MIKSETPILMFTGLLKPTPRLKLETALESLVNLPSHLFQNWSFPMETSLKPFYLITAATPRKLRIQNGQEDMTSSGLKKIAKCIS